MKEILIVSRPGSGPPALQAKLAERRLEAVTVESSPEDLAKYLPKIRAKYPSLKLAVVKMNGSEEGDLGELQAILKKLIDAQFPVAVFVPPSQKARLIYRGEILVTFPESIGVASIANLLATRGHARTPFDREKAMSEAEAFFLQVEESLIPLPIHEELPPKRKRDKKGVRQNPVPLLFYDREVAYSPAEAKIMRKLLDAHTRDQKMTRRELSEDASSFNSNFGNAQRRTAQAFEENREKALNCFRRQQVGGKAERGNDLIWLDFTPLKPKQK